VLIRAADIEDILTLHSEISHIDIRRDIHTGKVTDVDRTVGVWKRAGHKRSVEFLAHIIFVFIYFSFN
jgi:hypothetical protein